MAVSVALRSAALVPGSVRVILARWLLSIAVMLSGVSVAAGVVSSGPAAEPYFASAPQPLPLFQLVELLSRVGVAWAVAMVGVVLGWLGGQLLTAGAIEILRDPGRTGRGLWRATFDNGPASLMVYLRIAFAAALWLAALLWLVNRGIGWLADRGELSGWSASTLLWSLTVAQAIAVVLVGSAVGACGLLARAVVVAGRRRCVRRLHQIVPRLLWRAPFQGFMLQVVLASISVIVGAFVLFAWRQSGAGTAPWILVWLLVVFGQAYLWHWRLRICCALTDASRDAWASVPDEPWRFARRLWRRVRGVRTARAAETELRASPAQLPRV